MSGKKRYKVSKSVKSFQDGGSKDTIIYPPGDSEYMNQPPLNYDILEMLNQKARRDYEQYIIDQTDPTNINRTSPAYQQKFRMREGLTFSQLGGVKEQYYTYANSKNKYKKVGNKWYISNEGTDFKFVPIKDPTGSRTKELNKNAKVDPNPWVQNPNSIEGKINKAMGDVQGQAARAAEWHTPKEEDQRDNLRHSDAAKRTQQAIANATGSDLLGYYGSVALGTAHELGTMFSDDRPWNVVLKEAKEDFDNNLKGAEMGYFHAPNGTKRLSYLSNTFQIPDGYGLVKPYPGSNWTDPYDQIQREKAQQEVYKNPNPKPVGLTEKFQVGGMTTVKSKEGTITNKFINKKGQTVIQVKTKDGRYYEKVLEPQINPLDTTPRYQNSLLSNSVTPADNTRVIQDNGLPKDIQEVARRQEAAQRAFEESRRDEIKQGEEYGISAKTWDVITNPFTAAEYIISGGGLQNMPRNINEMRIAGIDPGVVQGRNLVGNTVNAFTNLVDAGDKVIRNVGEGNYLNAGLEAMRFLPSARLSTGLGKKVINNAPSISRFLPTYKNVYRVEPTTFTKDVADDLSGRWFGDLSEMPFYVKHLKDPEAGVRMIRAKVPTKTWESVSGYNMPINARLMSGGTGNYKTFMDAANAGEISTGAARRLSKSVPIPSDLQELSSNPRLINLSEGILPELKANKYRVAKPKKLSSFDRVEFPSGDLGREGAFDYMFNVSKDVEKPIFGIPRKYFPFQKGGIQDSETKELSRAEIKELRAKGYNVKYL